MLGMQIGNTISKSMLFLHEILRIVCKIQWQLDSREWWFTGHWGVFYVGLIAFVGKDGRVCPHSLFRLVGENFNAARLLAVPCPQRALRDSGIFSGTPAAKLCRMLVGSCEYQYFSQLHYTISYSSASVFLILLLDSDTWSVRLVDFLGLSVALFEIKDMGIIWGAHIHNDWVPA